MPGYGWRSKAGGVLQEPPRGEACRQIGRQAIGGAFQARGSRLNPGIARRRRAAWRQAASAPTWAENQSRADGHDLRIELLAVARHQHMAGLVDEAHGVKLAGMDDAVGMLFDVANLIHAVRELAAGRPYWQRPRCPYRRRETQRTDSAGAHSAKCGIPSLDHLLPEFPILPGGVGRIFPGDSGQFGSALTGS